MSAWWVRAGASGALVAGGLVALLAFCALTVAVVQEGVEPADALARALVQHAQQPWLRPVMEGASQLGGAPGQAAGVVLGCALLWRRGRRLALGLPAVMAGAALIQLAAKWGMDRPRPNLEPWGYPSGHSLSLVVLLGYLVYATVASSRSATWRTVVAGSSLATLATVAFSRLYLDAHWLSDVAGGMASGGAYLLLVLGLTRHASLPWPARGARSWLAGPGMDPVPGPGAGGGPVPRS